MDVKIINYCKKLYKFNPEELARHILEKIPDKYLVGLGEICLFDTSCNKNINLFTKYIERTELSKDSRIEIYMDNPGFHGFPFFSILSFNISFLEGINEHIEKYVKRYSHDKEVMLKDPLRFNYDWMFFGTWNPLFLLLFRLPHYLTGKSRLCKKTASFIIALVVRKAKKMMIPDD